MNFPNIFTLWLNHLSHYQHFSYSFLQNHSAFDPSNSSSSNIAQPIPILTNLIEPQLKEELPKEVPEPNLIQRIMTTSQSEPLAHQQELINQQMHLNIQLLSKKIESLESNPQKKDDSQQLEVKTSKKKIKKENTACGHADKEHYAKGMCSNCYHKNGRTKRPWKCSHQKLYANGLCQNCYINKYNKLKREKTQNTDPLNQEGLESRQQISESKQEDFSSNREE